MRSPNDSMAHQTVTVKVCISCGAEAPPSTLPGKCERCGGTKFATDVRAPRREGEYAAKARDARETESKQWKPRPITR